MEFLIVIGLDWIADKHGLRVYRQPPTRHTLDIQGTTCYTNFFFSHCECKVMTGPTRLPPIYANFKQIYVEQFALQYVFMQYVYSFMT